MFSNCLVNNSDPTQDYYRFSFEGIEDIRLYLACIYDEENNKADINTTLQNYKGIIDFVDSTTEVIDKDKKVISYDKYNFNFKESLKYIKEFTRELYETDLVLGLNNIIHAYSEDGYIDFYIIIGDEVFDSDFYSIIEKSIEKNFLDRRSKVMEEMLLEELECEEGKEEESGGDYSYENETSNSSEYISEELLEDLKVTSGQVQDLITKVNEMTGSDITLQKTKDSSSGSIEVEDEEIETCDILRYITVTDDDGNEEEVQVKALPKKYSDWEERFSDELTSKEIDTVNELYAKWYAKKNKGKTITLPDGRTAKVNTSEEHSSSGGTGNIMANTISALAGSGNSEADALLGALASMTSSGNVVSNMNNKDPEESKPQIDLEKAEETMNHNTK